MPKTTHKTFSTENKEEFKKEVNKLIDQYISDDEIVFDIKQYKSYFKILIVGGKL